MADVPADVLAADESDEPEDDPAAAALLPQWAFQLLADHPPELLYELDALCAAPYADPTPAPAPD